MPKTRFEVVTEQRPERAILVGIDRADRSWPLEESLAELERLTSTAGAEVVCTISQRLDTPNPRTFIGAGKAEELVSLVRNLDADVVVLDDELTPSQQSNLERLVGSPVKVIDRTALILDIFALHATSREGRLQVKLAQNQYLYPRLRGMWSHLASNRMGGGVGSRFGEGESQLEVDRRLVRKRISRIRRELADVASSRRTQRKSRNGSDVFRIALAGYTNAGKSSLMNRLTDADVLTYDKLFATLDSTTRQLDLSSGMHATLTDTVGFIQKLPHSLVEAFHSTLEEIREADLVLLVVDSSSAQRDAQIRAVREVLGEIGASEIPTVVVYNKVDLMLDERRDDLAHLRALNPDALFVSARLGTGIDSLVDTLSKEAMSHSVEMKLLVPYGKGAAIELAHEHAVVCDEEYTENGVVLRIRSPRHLAGRFSRYAVEDGSSPHRDVEDPPGP